MLPRDRDPRTSARPVSDRRPADYRSKSARLRIFALVAALMAVLVAMNEARKPGVWAWLWNGQRPAKADRNPINTRLPPRAQPRDSLPGMVDTSPSALAEQNVNATDENSVTSKVGVARHFWQHVWETLSYQEKNELIRLLRTARRGGSASESDAREWKPLAAKLDLTWNELFTSQSRDVLLNESEMSSERRRSALQVLTAAETMWNSQIKPAFDTAGQSSEWTAEQRAALAEAQHTLDLIAIEAVRDDTVWRPDERTAWFRLLETLQQSDPTTLARQSIGHVSFVQIFRQSQEYRGQVVSIRGTARMAYRVAAPSNDLGIREYCLFWIQPEDGSNRPIVVYALHPPDGFPAITTEQKKIHEQVEVTGYFFKRWVYRAADGLNSVPLIVAAAPTWFPAAAPPQAAQQQLAAALGPYFWPVMAGGVAGLVLATFGLAWFVHWSSRPSTVLAELRAKTEAAASASRDWDKLPATPSIEESLRHLEDVPPVK